MPIAADATRNALATTYSTLCTHAAAHSADPGSTGTSEMSGAGYARGAITWGTATGGTITGTATINMPTAGSTLDYIGAWSALTGGTFRDKCDITNVVYPGPGTAAVTIAFTQS